MDAYTITLDDYDMTEVRGSMADLRVFGKPFIIQTKTEFILICHYIPDTNELWVDIDYIRHFDNLRIACCYPGMAKEHYPDFTFIGDWKVPTLCTLSFSKFSISIEPKKES